MDTKKIIIFDIYKLNTYSSIFDTYDLNSRSLMPLHYFILKDINYFMYCFKMNIFRGITNGYYLPNKKCHKYDYQTKDNHLKNIYILKRFT